MNTLAASVHVTVLGAGSWGTALAALAARHCPTVLWARDPDVAQHIQATGHHPKHLNTISLPQNLQSTSSFTQALQHLQSQAQLIILGVPVAGLNTVCQQLAQSLLPANCTNLSVIWTCKGLHPDTQQLPHQLVQAHLAPLLDHGLGLGVLSGPSFAHEVAQGLPVALTIASKQAHTIKHTTLALHGNAARIYSSADIIGVEVGGAIKNIIAIACGIADGLKLGDNTRAALITRGLAEIQRLGLALGGVADTFFGLTGLGDLVLTTTGDQSRNRQVGLAIGQGHSLSHILSSGLTAEGVRCAPAALQLAQQHQLELPIIETVNQVLFHGLAPRTAVSYLLSRSPRPESLAPTH